ncbi:DUF1320 family protein [Aneurinibacillus sp. Ricciae_BoGa-3]|uniref:phage protein Gp36 family protein n=1 Tax=Aneurinibacillus sp. Ricciae_BoGa-3 TaxID=3022697 RepID=UPI0023414ECA|nr:phage protein Gp36 family protein [Aneurinibacillus sp. Ricciae_BoGa-3]WCK55426.1 DUF1320 family protein [Aneurinibacillus sp. Ricciae_BoGa-3]
MSYCTPDDVRPLTKLAEKKPDDYFDFYINKAVAFVDSRLSRRYNMPITGDLPPIVISICADLAASFILDQHTTERFKDQTTYGEVLYKRAVTTMERIMEHGELDFILPMSTGVASESNRPAIRTTMPHRSPLERSIARMDRMDRWGQINRIGW